MTKKLVKKIFTKAVPLWLVVFLLLNTTALTSFIQFYLVKKEQTQLLTRLAKTTSNQDQLIEMLKQQVLPAKGYQTAIKWNNLGKQLVEIGAIDKTKLEQAFNTEPSSKESLKYLDGNWDELLMINEKNSRVMVDLLWALGLVNKSSVLEMGPMQKNPAEYASTQGWTLGAKESMELYSSQELIKLTPKQQELVKKIAENVSRACCNNPTSFPDCNHGMAALGYIQLGVKNGLSEGQIYKDLLAFNSFWFPQNYIEIAAYFSKQGIAWDQVDAKLVLSRDYSSATGIQNVKQAISDLPGFQVKNNGGGCGA